MLILGMFLGFVFTMIIEFAVVWWIMISNR